MAGSSKQATLYAYLEKKPNDRSPYIGEEQLRNAIRTSALQGMRVARPDEDYVEYLREILAHKPQHVPQNVMEVIDMILTLAIITMHKRPIPDTLTLRRSQRIPAAFRLQDSWRELAEKIGFSQTEIDMIDEFKENQPKNLPFAGIVEVVLTHWQMHHNMRDEPGHQRRFRACNPQEFSKILREINRHDVHQVAFSR